MTAILPTESQSAAEVPPPAFFANDYRNPHNWSNRKKSYVLLTATLASINSTMGSSLTSNLVDILKEAFHVPSDTQMILPASMYLMGFVFGPLIFAPMSENYGRRPVIVTGFALFILTTLVSALVPNWGAFLFFRFLAGTFAAPPMSVVGGMLSDVYDDKAERGMAMMFWSAATLSGALIAPIIAGFTGHMGWQWTFWIALIVAGATFVLVMFLPETLASKILAKSITDPEKDNGIKKYMYLLDIARNDNWSSLKTILSRPLTLLFSEMILFLACIYMAFVYAVFYMMLEIVPEIFVGIYDFSAGLGGVSFLSLQLGGILAMVSHFYSTGLTSKLSAKSSYRHLELLRLPGACVGGPIFAASLIWLGWSSKRDIHWVVPLLSMVPYGWAYQSIFVAMYNYMADAYGSEYGASAFAAMSMTRSLAGAFIPLSVVSMIESCGIAWSCTILGLISFLLSLVPFCFVIWGPRIRKSSKFFAE